VGDLGAGFLAGLSLRDGFGLNQLLSLFQKLFIVFLLSLGFSIIDQGAKARVDD